MFTESLTLQDSLLLTDIYKPRSTAEFVGLEKPKRLAAALAKKPFSSYYIFRGGSRWGRSS